MRIVSPVTNRIVIAGSLAQRPGHGGLTWFMLQFLLGFRRLGWEVLFLDRLEPEMCIDDDGQPCPAARSANLRYLYDVMDRFGLHGRFSVVRGEENFGLDAEQTLDRIERSAFLLNVMGYFNQAKFLSAAPRTIFLDIDPGFPQMWRDLGLHDAFEGHDSFVTVGRNIGRPDCAIPTCGLKWIAMPQPVVLDHWPVQPPQPDAAFTSIGAWRGPNGPIEFRGHRYGLRVHEFRKFLELPSRCPGTQLEMAFEIHPGDANDIQALGEHGWNLANPQEVAGSPAGYRSYIARSKAEFMVPKQMYVDTNSGLLSDRSVYYLASGRPVLARDTGIKDLYPTGEGLLTFTTLDEAAAGVEEINGNYVRHCKAARHIAEEHFNSDKVLRRLLADLDVD